MSYTQEAVYYDAIYAARGKDYGLEADRLHAIIQRHTQGRAQTLLDVACGTGTHLTFLRRRYTVEGLELDGAMLAIARLKHPDLPIHQGDMVDFDLGRQFDAVTCLFSAIAYAHPLPRLHQAVATMARHVRPGGVLVVEPFVPPQRWTDGYIGADFVDQPNLKVARMNVSRREGNVGILDFHFLVATPAGVEHFTERHDLALYTHEEYMAAFRRADLEVFHDPEGLIGRGLYIADRAVA